MNILITGGAGYIGSVLTGLLLNRGFGVRVYDSLLFGIDPILPYFRHPCFEMFQGDIRDGAKLKRAMGGIDAVVHLAAIVGYPACDRDPRTAEAVNLDGTATLDLARGSRPVVFASTGSVYGKLETLCDEDSKPNPLTVYGKTKLTAEQILLEGGNAVVYRFATAFGLSPRLRLDLLVNDFTYQAVVNRYLVVYEADFRRTFLHVYDIARAIHHALENTAQMEGQVFNCGSNALNATKRQIVERISQHAQFNAHFAEIGQDADQRDYEVDYGRLSRVGYQHTVSLDQGISEMVNAFKYLRVKNPYSNVGV